MIEIIISNPLKDSLTEQFISLYRVLFEISNSKEFILNFSKLNKLDPLLLLPLCVLINEKNYGYFLSQSSVFNLFNAVFLCGKNQSFFEIDSPILVFSTKLDIKSRDNLVEGLVERLYGMIGKVKGTKDAIFYPISELIMNIFEHSRQERGWIFANINSEKQYLDICIVDSGRGLRESYRQEKALVISHSDAIGQVMIGNSTKSAKERGYGVKTSRKLICNGLNGSFLILSGNAVLIVESKQEKFLELDKVEWQGVILAYRIPLFKQPFNIYPYLE